MASVSIILGTTGTGKSTSIRGLDPKETVIINVLGKRLPFKGSNAVYNREKRNLFQVESSEEIVRLINQIDENAPHVKNVVIDDCSYTMRKEYFNRAKERGYDRFVDIAVHTQQIIQACEKAREDIDVFLMYHSEDVVDNGTIVTYKIATIGKMLDQTYNPMEVVPVVLFSTTKFDDKGMPTYGFITHRMQVNGIAVPAKSPDGMFKDDFIPNDLGLVKKAFVEYYN